MRTFPETVTRSFRPRGTYRNTNFGDDLSYFKTFLLKNHVFELLLSLL